MKKEPLKTKEEAEAHILGKIAGLNSARLLIWGIGYDKDETAQMMRHKLNEEIFALKEILEIENLGDSWFENATDLLKT